MTTAISMMKRAMRLAGAIGQGETPTSDEATDGLAALNTMLEGWGISRNAIYEVQNEQFTWPSNTQAPTVGSGGTFNTTRPAKIDDTCSFTVGSNDYPARLLDLDAWAGIPDKSTTSQFAWWIYPEYGASLVTLYGYPIPNASVTFNLRSWKALQSFSTTTTALAMPPGYQRAIEYNLAIEWACPEFGLPPRPDVLSIARSSLRALKNMNSPSPIMGSEAAMMNRRYQSNINAGSA